MGAGLGVQARRQQAWQQTLGRAGTAWACSDGRAGRGRQGMDPRGRAADAGERGRRAGGRARQAGAGRARRTAWARGARGLGVPGRAWSCLGVPGALAGPVWGSCSQFGF